MVDLLLGGYELKLAVEVPDELARRGGGLGVAFDGKVHAGNDRRGR